jgi:mannosyltransferase OCH1-like enzyme
MIPKIIHYCWFGGAPLPEKERQCIESWRKYCPDYEIKLWNESNYDISQNEYIRQAY